MVQHILRKPLQPCPKPFVGLDITVQAFQSTRREHAIAVALAFLPAIAYLINIKFGGWVAPEAAAGQARVVAVTTSTVEPPSGSSRLSSIS